MSICAYCDTRRAVNSDHIVPKAERQRLERRYGGETSFSVTVPACFECNNLKSTRRLVPPSWANRLVELEALTNKTWKVWNGDPNEPAFREVIR